MEGRKRYNPNQHVIPTKVGIPDKNRQNKKLDARLRRRTQFREHDNEKMLVTQEMTPQHNLPCHSCLEQESPTQLNIFLPSLKRVAGFIETGDDQKSGNPVQICSAPTGRYYCLVRCCYRYFAPTGRLAALVYDTFNVKRLYGC